METRTSRHKDLDHHSHQPSSSSPRNTVCVLSDHQPANHQEFELSVIGEITEETTVNTGNSKEHCAQGIISEFEDARTQKISSESNTVVIEAEIHADNTDAQHMVQFEEAQDFSDAGYIFFFFKYFYYFAQS